LYQKSFVFYKIIYQDAVPDLDKVRPYAIPLVMPLLIPHLHEWRQEVCLINFNKGEDNEGYLKFCTTLKWSATV
jgi:hypothetical protein